jgi:hypothetical protein
MAKSALARVFDALWPSGWGSMYTASDPHPDPLPFRGREPAVIAATA